MPGSCTLQIFCQRLLGDDGVFGDLEVEHAYADEVRALFEGVLETLAGMDGAGGEDLVGDPRFVDGVHKRDSFLGVVDPDIIVVAVVVELFLALYGPGFAVFLGRGGPVVLAVKGLHIELGANVIRFPQNSGPRVPPRQRQPANCLEIDGD